MTTSGWVRWMVAILMVAAPAAADEPGPSAEVPETPATPMSDGMQPGIEGETGDDTEEGEKGEKKPKRGDFDAGGNLRFPSGPDEMNQFATFNWVAVDLRGSYFLLDFASVSASIPLAIIKPDTYGDDEPSYFGGFSTTLDLRLPELPFQVYKTDVRLYFTGAYMREGAMLLSDKDFPLYINGFEPGLNTGLQTRVQLSSLLDFSLAAAYVYQSGDMESLQAVQLPISLIVKLGSLVKVSVDLGIYTGDDYSFSGDDGGRITTGGALDVKIGPVIVHAGAGVASLLTGGLYPSISDSFYVDLNAKFAK